jgi:hypothetical protein
MSTSLDRIAQKLGDFLAAGVIAWLVTIALPAIGAVVARFAFNVGWPITTIFFIVFVIALMVARLLLITEHFYKIERAPEAEEKIVRMRDVSSPTTELKCKLATLEEHIATKDQIHALAGDLRALGDKVAVVDWTYNAEEHRREVYRKIAELVGNPRVRKYWVVTNFRPLVGRVDEKTLAQIDVYYKTIEKALGERPSFDYRRVAILRGDVSGPPPRHAQTDNEAALRRFITSGYRQEFLGHFERIYRNRFPRQAGARAQIKVCQTGGRFLDLSFALALSEDDEALALVIEFGVARAPTQQAETERDALALLTLQHPSAPLKDAFVQAFSGLMDTDEVLESIDDVTVRQFFLESG